MSAPLQLKLGGHQDAGPVQTSPAVAAMEAHKRRVAELRKRYKRARGARRKEIANQLAKLGVTVERVDSATPPEIVDAPARRYNRARPIEAVQAERQRQAAFDAVVKHAQAQ